MTPALMDTPRIDGVFPTSVVLVWEAPDDNGAKIMGYKVEIEKVGGLVDLDDGKGKGKKSSKNAVKKQLTGGQRVRISLRDTALSRWSLQRKKNTKHPSLPQQRPPRKQKQRQHFQMLSRFVCAMCQFPARGADS